MYREFNNLMRLTGREQVSHKTLSELVAELELYGFVEVERKGRGRGRGAVGCAEGSGCINKDNGLNMR